MTSIEASGASRPESAAPVSVGAAKRPTRQRKAVAEVLDALDEFRTAQDIHVKLRERGEGVGLTTVYRHLTALADSGVVDVIRTADGEQMFRACSTETHHHHLVCRGCGRTEEIDGPAVERWADKVAAQHGYTGVSHTLEIFGDCPDCVRP